jgi:hypothetical protein
MDVFVFDDLQPEDNAMVQALYSRDPASVLAHREKVERVGSGKFLDTYYIGYGHPSIGDCGSTTIYTEQVSMLVAKALQDAGLYSGQEASTRYLDFSKQAIFDPYNHFDSRAILARWMEMYNHYMPLIIEGLKVHHPYDPELGKSEAQWLKAIQVRAFDTVRSLLPIGTTTLLSWHSNLRQARDQLRYLFSHPLPEVVDVVKRIHAALVAKYPNSFDDDEVNEQSTRYAERNAYMQRQSVENHYITPDVAFSEIPDETLAAIYHGEVGADLSHVDIERINQDVAALIRPRGSLLPKRLQKHGSYNYQFLLDFGSFRDLQRHRNGYCPVPLVGNDFGFHTRIDDEFERLLSPEDYMIFSNDVADQLAAIETLAHHPDISATPVEDQYLYPMGMACAVHVTYSLAQSVYVAELRSSQTVHFTLRPVAQEIGAMLKDLHPELSLYVDMTPDEFSLKRGEQDIIEKSQL